ncbi:hypothetical protein ACJD0Z_04310 [Flavobacteriaceae bacterium M23B6Z8]
MKNKRNTYLLLVLVLAIWGIIGYRIVGALAPDDTEITKPVITAEFNPKPIQERERFSISSYNRDPFLGTIKVKKTHKPQKQVNTTAPKEEPWPDIRYAGRVGDSESEEDIFFIYINDTQHLFTNGFETNGVKLLKGDASGVMLRFKGKTRQYTLDE